MSGRFFPRKNVVGTLHGLRLAYQQDFNHFKSTPLSAPKQSFGLGKAYELRCLEFPRKNDPSPSICHRDPDLSGEAISSIAQK